MQDLTTDSYIPRLVENKLNTLIEAPTIVMITGARQVGKSTLMQKLQEQVNEKYATRKTSTSFEINKTVFSYTLDDIQLRSALRKDIRFIEKDISLALGENLHTTNQKVFIFIDEVQKYPQLFDWIKQVFDKNSKNIKFIITGSSALGLSKSVGETLAGRVEYVHVFPIVFPELVKHRTDMQTLWLHDFVSGSLLKKPADLQSETSKSESFKHNSPNSNNQTTSSTQVASVTDSILAQLTQGADNNLSLQDIQESLNTKLAGVYQLARQKERDLTALVLESMFYGGLPRLYNVKLEERVRLLRNYISVYLEKEIGFIARNIDLELFGLSLQSFASQNGGPLNINQVSKEVGVARASLYKYLDLLENTFLIKRIYPYGQGKLKDSSKSLSLYYLDSGILNSLLFVSSIADTLKPDNFNRNLGTFVLVNLLSVMSLLDNPSPVFYWQDYEGHKVDFIVEQDSLVLAFILDIPKDIRKFKATKSKFASLIGKDKNIVFVYPTFDAKNFDISYKLAQDTEIDNALELYLPLQLLF